MAQANLVANRDFDNKLINLNKRINSNKIKHVLLENDLKKLQTFGKIYFRSKNHFEKDVTEKLFSISANAEIC